MHVVFEDSRFVDGREVAMIILLALLRVVCATEEVHIACIPSCKDVQQRGLSAGTISSMVLQ